ncbi:TolC family protein [Bacteroidota bacterium]
MRTLKNIKLGTLIMVLSFVFLASGGVAQNTLPKYISESDNNPGLKAKYKEYEMTMENIVRQGFFSDPTFSAGMFINPVETRLGAQRVKLSVSQMFPWFGTVNAREQEAIILANSKFEDYLLFKSKLHYDIKITWFDMYMNVKESEFAKKQIELIKILSSHALQMFETGLLDMTDVLQFQMLVDEFESKLLTLDDKGETLKAKFNLLLNNDPESEIIIPDTILFAPDDNFNIDSIVDNNHILRSLRARHEAASYSEIISNKLSKPKIGVGLDYVIVSKRTDANPSGNGKDIIMPMASLSVPIFKKKNQSRINKSQLKKEQLALMIDDKVAQIKLDYRISIQKYNDAIREAELYKKLLNKNTMSLNIVKAGYISSKIKYPEVLNIFQMDYNFKIMYYKAFVDEKRSLASLEYLMGK